MPAEVIGHPAQYRRDAEPETLSGFAFAVL